MMRVCEIADRYESLIARVGFILIGAYALYAAHNIWTAGIHYAHREVVFLYFLAYAGAFSLLFLGVFGSDVAKRRPWLGLLLSLYLITAQFYTHWLAVGADRGTDALLFGHYGALLFLEGKNPYQESMGPAYEALNMPRFYMTPYIDGTPHERFGYPALSFLIYVPFVWMGLADMRWVHLLLHLMTLVALYLAAPRPFRAVAFAPFLMDLYLLDYLVAGVMDIVWVFGLVCMALLWRRRAASGLCYGLSCAYKPLPWLLAPFILIRILREKGGGAIRWRDAGRFLSAAILGFVLPNLPFILWNPRSWLETMNQMTTREAIMWGSGLSLLTQDGLLPLPVSFYSGATAMVFVLLLYLYARHFDIAEHAFWLLPGVVMWFSYRSLSSYFVYWTPLLLLSLYELYHESRTPLEQPA